MEIFAILVTGGHVLKDVDKKRGTRLYRGLVCRHVPRFSPTLPSPQARQLERVLEMFFSRLRDVSPLLPRLPRSASRRSKLGVFLLRTGLFHLCKAQLEAGFTISKLRNNR